MGLPQPGRLLPLRGSLGCPGRESEEPYFGRLSTDLFLRSPSTINLKTRVHTRPLGHRPFIELEPTDHPLAVHQRTGITMERVRAIAEAVLHPTDSREPQAAGAPR